MSLQHARGAYLHPPADELLLHLLLGVCQIAHFAGAQADARSGDAIICDAEGEEDTPDSMESIAGHLPDVTNT